MRVRSRCGLRSKHGKNYASRLFVVGQFLMVAAPSASGAPARFESPPTHLVIYSPFSINGGLAPGVKVTARASGYCWTGSLSDPRSDAWRCFRGNLIYDPCFSGSFVTKWVACPLSAPFGAHVLRLNLTKPLPFALADKTSDPTAGDPTTVRLTTGVTCVFADGATGTLAGMRLNYVCAGGAWLVGDPRRNTPTWTIFYVPRLSSSQIRTVGIATAYW